MSHNEDPLQICTRVSNLEGWYLDNRYWQQWLDLYCEDAVYWVPAWLDENTETQDPHAEISQIYHQTKEALAERVSRVESGLSVTAMPLARTTHFVSNLMVTESARERIAARANMQVHVFQPRTAQQYVNFGYYEVQLKQVDQQWLIAAKTIHLKNDLIPALVDFYTL